jgi:hypothetical protein
LRGRPSAEKRRKEISRQDKKKDKAARREQRKQDKAASQDASLAEGVDPDIAGIVPGPQPLPWDDEDDAEGDRAAPEARRADVPSRDGSGAGHAAAPARRS